MFLEGSCEKRNYSFVYLSMMKEAIVTLRFSPRHLLLAISANPVRVFKCFTKLNRLLCASLLNGTLNFSLWIAKFLAPLELQVSLVATE